MTQFVMALDEGTTSARAVLVDEGGAIVAEARNAVTCDFPRPGWVELDPTTLWQHQLASMAAVLAKAGATMDDVAAIGITTHRETCMLWDRATGEPVHPFVSWMSKQTDHIVKRWRGEGLDEEFRSRTGLFNDSFFSAAKVSWLLDEVPGVRARAERGELAFGTVDSWLLWNLTSGRTHLTDHSEASRTALLNLETLDWDDKLCAAAGIPDGLLPPAVASDADFGHVDPAAIGLPGTRHVPVRAVMADQQAGMFGQACFTPGSTKNTFGTAGVLTANTGSDSTPLDGVTASVGWTVEGRTDYEAEGVVFHSGQTLQWMREKLGVLGTYEHTEEVAGTVPDSGGVYVVPAFVGICAPRWIREARAGMVGLTLETTRAHVVRAGLEAMAYQTRDCVDALVAGGIAVPELRVDGGAAANDLLCQFQADILGIPVLRPQELERTALGVAHVAGMGVGRWAKQDLADSWTVERVFEPQMSEDRRAELYDGWCAAVDSVCGSGS